MPAFFEFFSALFHPSARLSDDQTIKLTSGLHETDDNFFPGENLSQMYRDRYDYDRQTILAERVEQSDLFGMDLFACGAGCLSGNNEQI